MSSNEIIEGENGVLLQLNLSSQPLYDVVVNFNANDLILDNSEIIFTSSNWNNPQSITINAPNNDTYDGDQDHNVWFDLTSEDPNFNEEGLNNFIITVRDDEEPIINNFIKGRIWKYYKDGQIDNHEQGLSNFEVFIDENNNNVFDQGENSIVTELRVL